MNLDEAIASKAAAFSVTEVASLLHDVDPRTVIRACEEGQLRSLRIGRRLLIPRLPLLALLGANEAGVAESEAGPATDPAIATTAHSTITGADPHDRSAAGALRLAR